MHKFSVFFLVAVIAPSVPVMAGECPVDDTAVENAGDYGKAVEAAVESASNCERAYQMLEVCQLGSSADNALADIVQLKCEPLFAANASPATKKPTKGHKTAATRLLNKTKGQCIRAWLPYVELERRGIFLANTPEKASR